MQSSDELLKAINNIKVVVFVEDNPLTDHFHQVVFNEAQARVVRDAVVSALNPGINLDSATVFNLVTDEDVALTLPNIREVYDDEPEKKG